VRIILPNIAEIAVMATISSIDKFTLNNNLEKCHESLVASSLENLKKFMIFYRLRENQQVCEIIVRAKLNEKIYNLGSMSQESITSVGEL
jgi:hypothetical protein